LHNIKNDMHQRFPIFSGIFLFIFGELFISNAFAYIDPSTGSMILQSLIGVFVGIGIVLKVYWTKIKFAIFNRKSKKD
jgi:hypothetical protein